ncbi:hypothetical protein MMYC01_200364 [Madurella mycetomatis]|uniref:25S rRNA (Uridine(2843)-N(3))-methyltransferase n=1 Tax=Madurella mycetomatis TaxID=100816 RepID=A0A175WJW1_9PEZI|nr:hypothetical protein MMYC01_200364 [Madurella mycetomatis]
MAGKKGAPSGPARAKANNHTRRKNQPDSAHTALSSKHGKDDQYQKQSISDSDIRHQQRVLDVFRHAFPEVLSSPNLTTTLQSVKQALFERDFAKAFGDPEHLAVYAARWSPTRALCYASVLGGIKEQLELISSSPAQADSTENGENGDGQQAPQELKVLSIGGGAAELVALGAFLNQSPSLSGSITLLDSGPWANVVSQLTAGLTTPPPLSKYASSAAKLSNTAMVSPSRLNPTFFQHDALTFGNEGLGALLGHSPLLITVLFTLNEIFTTNGIGKTTAFLLDLTSSTPVGSLLLVVDSPGSYSEASVGKDAKRYPMQWLLDRIMLGTRRDPVNGRRWAKLESQDSVWFRLAGPEALDYPIPLENMRYQMHLYKAEDASLDED